MNITILGGGGFLGRKLANRLAKDGTLGGTRVSSLVLFDLTAPPAPEGAAFPVTSIGGDLAELPDGVIPPGTSVVFHLAAVVSAQAEADYDLGRRVNVRGTDAVIDACRKLASPPRVVFTSSIASYGGGQNVVLNDSTKQMPGGSYGAQKAAAELFLSDASRRGFMDVVSLRLPTIIVRPGRPNKAASSFFSSIIREPLLGLQTDLPVGDDFKVWVASPRRAVEWLLHAATMDTSGMGLDRSLNPPGMSVNIGQMLAALETVRQGAGTLINRISDPALMKLVSTWPAQFDTARASGLGFSAHEPLLDVVRAFVEDDLAPTKAERGIA